MMGENFYIREIKGRQILDSRGNPTVEAQVELENGCKERAAVPSGASTGKYEAVELRDGGKPYGGLGVTKAAENIREKISPLLAHKPVTEQKMLDELMCQADETENKQNFGANAILGVSMAAARAAAKAKGQPLYQYLADLYRGEAAGGPETEGRKYRLPVPMMNILNGGKHAKNTVDFQEFMIMPAGAVSFREALRMGTEVYHALKKLLEKDGKSTAVGDEGGFAPDLKDAFEVFDYLTKAVEEAGYVCGKDIVFAMDAAASELFEENSGMYYFPGESELAAKKQEECRDAKAGDTTIAVPDTKKTAVLRSTEELIRLYESLCQRYPLYSIEDGLHEEDWAGWQEMTRRLGQQVQLVGDDLFVTNTSRLERGIRENCGNSILIKLNQIGTVTETMEAVAKAGEAGYTAVVSHRSGETEDTFIADLAVALSCGQIKTGAPCRTDRVAKYNQLLRIEEELGEAAVYPGFSAFQVRH